MTDDMVDPAIADMLALPAPDTNSVHATADKKRLEGTAFAKAELIAGLNNGERVTDIYRRLNTNYNQIRRWASDDADFAREWAEARENNSELLAEGLISITETEFNPQMAKVQSENIKWVLGVRDRNKYGNKVEVTQNDTSALVDVLKMAVARIPRPADATNVRPVIEGELVSPCITDVLNITKDNS